MATKEQKENRYSDIFFPHSDEFLAHTTYFHVSKNLFPGHMKVTNFEANRLFRLLQGESGPVGSRGEMGGPGEKVNSQASP